MKARNLWKLSPGVLLTLMPLACRALEPAPTNSTDKVVAEAGVPAGPEAVEAAGAPPATLNTNEAPNTDIADAPAKSIANEKPLPARLRPGGPAAEVIKLANS